MNVNLPGPIDKREGANLPHWTRDAATYFVTFRLADSLPEGAKEKLRHEVRELERQIQMGATPLTAEDEDRYAQLRSEKYEQLLDNGYGECVLRRSEIAEVVANALRFFDGDRYDLWAWCVMPNHVHVVFQPAKGHSMSLILKSWKSFTGRKAGELLGRKGGIWQSESFDHLIRNEADFVRCVQYTLKNPEVAGLRDWKWVGDKTK
ncbi:MAG: transposase [Planctomycetes bacterium]|nr:transposase [Planctomycetota bacterium]